MSLDEYVDREVIERMNPFGRIAIKASMAVLLKI